VRIGSLTGWTSPGRRPAARCGGDEFVVLLPDASTERCALCVAEKIRSRLAAPCLVNGHAITATSSIGIAVYPGDGSSQEAYIRKADDAMYRAKALGETGMRETRISFA
jgi:diguanylate cyclase (GGDEF)-like protein